MPVDLVGRLATFLYHTQTLQTELSKALPFVPEAEGGQGQPSAKPQSMMGAMASWVGKKASSIRSGPAKMTREQVDDYNKQLFHTIGKSEFLMDMTRQAEAHCAPGVQSSQEKQAKEVLAALSLVAEFYDKVFTAFVVRDVHARMLHYTRRNLTIFNETQWQ
jgi:hypothetical protein